MRIPKEAEAIADVEATRETVMETIRGRAEAVVEQLQNEVFRLLEEAHRSPEGGHAAETSHPEPPPARHGADARKLLDGEVRHAIADIVRAELAALDVAALVKAEVDAQLRAVTKLLQERLKASPRSNLQKLSPLLSRRVR